MSDNRLLRLLSSVAALCVGLLLAGCDDDANDSCECGYCGSWQVTFGELEGLGLEPWHLEISASRGDDRVSLTNDGLVCDRPGYTLDPGACSVSANLLCTMVGADAGVEPDVGVEVDGDESGEGTDLWKLELTFSPGPTEWTGTGQWEWWLWQNDDISAFGPATATATKQAPRHHPRVARGSVITSKSPSSRGTAAPSGGSEAPSQEEPLLRVVTGRAGRAL
jgi:hypothetical protein